MNRRTVAQAFGMVMFISVLFVISVYGGRVLADALWGRAADTGYFDGGNYGGWGYFYPGYSSKGAVLPPQYSGGYAVR